MPICPSCCPECNLACDASMGCPDFFGTEAPLEKPICPKCCYDMPMCLHGACLDCRDVLGVQQGAYQPNKGTYEFLYSIYKYFIHLL